MTKAHSPKPPTKLETITLKVYIHCEGCRRKVRRIIRVLDGVEDVTVDSASGKVTVTGTSDAKTILQRLQKYGKHAEMWPSSNPALAAAAKAGGNQPKPANNNDPDSNSKKKTNTSGESGDKAVTLAGNEGKKGGGKKEDATPAMVKGGEGVVNENKVEKSKEVNPAEVNNESAPPQNGGSGGGGGGGGGGKKGKKGGNGNNSNNDNNSGGSAPEKPSSAPVHDVPVMSAPANSSITVSANKSLAPYDSIQTGYSDYHSAEYATHMFSDENANNCSIM